MPASLAIELRERIVGARIDHGMRAREIGELFQVSEKTVRRLLSKHDKGESLLPKFAPGPTRKLGDRENKWLREQLASNPYLTSYELSARYNKRFRSNRVHRSTILGAIGALGLTHKKRPR